jgi:tripartite-type tricarboxylate transporter receptor subunit TctC
VDTQSINPLTYQRLTYDPDRDFAPVSLVTTVPMAIIIGPSRPAIGNMAALVAAASGAPERISYASWGVGSTRHLAFLRLAQAGDFRMLHVPFNGIPTAIQSILSGDVDTMMLPIGPAEAAARDGRVRILATVSPERLPLAPQVPTLREQGIELSIGLWQALFAPAATPAAVIARLNAATHEAMRRPSFTDVLRSQGAVPEPGTPQKLLALQRRERAAYAAVVGAISLRLD